MRSLPSTAEVVEAFRPGTSIDHAVKRRLCPSVSPSTCLARPSRSWSVEFGLDFDSAMGYERLLSSAIKASRPVERDWKSRAAKSEWAKLGSAQTMR